MAQSLSKVYLHIVFSTKNREPFITDKIEDRLLEYLGGICNILNSPPIIIGGYENHIHILCLQSRTISISTLVQKIKGSSSKWIKETGDENYNFYWQKRVWMLFCKPAER